MHISLAMTLTVRGVFRLVPSEEASLETTSADQLQKPRSHGPVYKFAIVSVKMLRDFETMAADDRSAKGHGCCYQAPMLLKLLSKFCWIEEMTSISRTIKAKHLCLLRSVHVVWTLSKCCWTQGRTAMSSQLEEKRLCIVLYFAKTGTLPKYCWTEEPISMPQTMMGIPFGIVLPVECRRFFPGLG